MPVTLAAASTYTFPELTPRPAHGADGDAAQRLRDVVEEIDSHRPGARCVAAGRSVFQARSGHVRETVPPPDLTRWHSISDPSERLEVALRELYNYYERLEPLLENVQRDAVVMPVVAEMNAYRVRYLEEIRDLLVTAWAVRG